MVAEVIGWIALGGSLACLLIALLIRIVDGRWLRTEAVVVDGEEERSVVRWFAEGGFHSRHLSEEERAQVVDPLEEPAFYKEREPDRLRLHEAPLGRRILRNLGLVLLGIAAVAGVVGLVLSFVG